MDNNNMTPQNFDPYIQGGKSPYTSGREDIYAEAEREMNAQMQAGYNPYAQSMPNVAPVQNAAPAPNAAPVQNVAPAPNVAPVQNAAPVPNVAPVQNATPAPNAAPVQNATPVPNAAPVQNVAPAPNAAPVQNVAPVQNAAPAPNVAPAQNVQPMSNGQQAYNPYNQPTAGTGYNPYMQGGPQPGQVPYMQSGNIKQKPVKKKTFEESLGKNIMGILASILIFAGIILLATAVSEIVTDGIKMAAILAISIVMAGVGLIGMKVKRNSFFLSLAGCGVGAIFISIILAYSYFELIGIAVMYVALAVWCVLVSFLGGKDGTVFRVVGQIGVLVSLIFGTSELARADEEGSRLVMALVLVVFFMAISCLYLFLDRKGKKMANLLSLTIDMLGVIFMYVAFIQVKDELFLTARIMAAIVVDLYATALIVIYIRRLLKADSGVGFHVYWVIYMIFSIISSLICSGILFAGNKNADYLVGLSGLLIVVLFWAAVSLKNVKDSLNLTIKIILYIAAVIMSCFLGDIFDFVGIALFAMPLIVGALITKKKRYIAFALVSFNLYAFIGSDYAALFCFLCMLYGIGLLLSGMFCKRLYSMGFKFWGYIVMEIAMFRFTFMLQRESSLSLMSSFNCIYIAMTVLCLLCSLLFFKKNWATGIVENASVWFLRIQNVLVMFYGWIMLLIVKETGDKVIDSIFLLASVVLNIYPMTKQYKKNGLLGFYNCFKLTLYLVIVLSAFEADGYVKTLACLLMAIGTIIFGFALDYKTTRLYGLILSCLAIGKLVLFDIEYNSNITKAITVIVCGIIAFAICLLYNILDKKFFGTQVKQAVAAGQPVQNINYNQTQVNAYGQPVNQAPANPYGQPVNQASVNPYGQPVNQASVNPYGQPVNQASVNPYGQPVNQAQANPYGQPVGQVPANPYGQPVGQVMGNPYAQPVQGENANNTSGATNND